MLQMLSVARRIAPGANGTTEYVLEPLPLSGIMLHVEAQTTAANTAPNINDLFALITNVELLLAGTTIWQATLHDLAFMGAMMFQHVPRYLPNGQGSGDITSLDVWLPLCRHMGDVNYGLPGTPAGQLRLRITAVNASGGLTAVTWSIDAAHQDQMQSKGFLRCTTLQRTAASTGDIDVDLPVGRSLAGVGVFSTTIRVTSAGLRGVSRVKLLRNSEDTYYPTAEFETLQSIANEVAGNFLGTMDHVHLENTAGAYAQNATTGGGRQTRGIGFSHGYVDLDPLADYQQMLDLTNCNRAVLRVTMDTAELFRLLPVEFWASTSGRSMQNA